MNAGTRYTLPYPNGAAGIRARKDNDEDQRVDPDVKAGKVAEDQLRC
jgi:hypothetical protein